MTKVAAEAGLKDPTDAELRRFDKQRKDKKVSNADWQSPSDPDSRIAKLKDGTTHLAYKAEHVVDLDSNLVLIAEIHPADQADSATLPPSLTSPQLSLFRAGNFTEIKAIVADQATIRGRRSSTAPPGAFGPTSPNRSRRTSTSGQTSRRSSSEPTATTGGGCAGSATNNCIGGAASTSRGPSPTSARRSGAGAVGGGIEAA